MTEDPWHYPRGELAQHILQALTVVDLIAIFAPRRKGKTWFVLRDLSPASVKRRYVPVYASLWRTPDKPHLAVTEALRLASEMLKRKRVPWRDYLSRLSSVSVNVAGIGGGSLGLTRKAEASDEALTLMGKLLDDVVNAAEKRDRRVLLLLDEAQHLATSSAFDATTKSLRTAIEGIRATRPGSLKAVFTGSSRTDLAVLLEHRNAAFYRSFDRQELPDLSRDYTDFVSAQLERLGRVRVDRDALWEVFDDLHRSPYFMQEVIRELMLKRAGSLDEAHETVARNIRDNPEISARWSQLNALEQALFARTRIAAPYYSSEALETLAADSGRESVTSGQVQNALRQLTRRGYIGATDRRGEYRIEDTELMTWLELRGKVD